MKQNEIETFTPNSANDWRQWLKKNHASKESVWLILYKKDTGYPYIAWTEAVDEALCYGWVDSKRQSIDDVSFRQFFCRRKPNSIWSKINKEKIDRLVKSGKIRKAGLEAVERAKENGSWSILDDVEAMKIPKDLEKAFRAHSGSKKFYQAQTKSIQKMMLGWIALAKREDTRQKRIEEITSLAAQGKKPKQF